MRVIMLFVFVGLFYVYLSLTYTAGTNATAVTAIPNSGYHFVVWSDGLETATRTDNNVTVRY